MNTGRFVLTFVVVWIVYVILSFVLNGAILNWEGVEGMKMEMGTGSNILGAIGELIFAFMFCFIFTKGYENKGVSEGFRFGFYIGLLMAAPLLFLHFAFYTYSAGLVWGFAIGNFIIYVILGIVAALLYKPQAAA